MSKKKKTSKTPDNNICQNKKAKHDYFLEEHFEAGLSLEGWEVKSLRDGRANLKESYIQIKNGEAFLYGAHISPLPSASTHVNPNPTRHRKLLLQRMEISRLIGAVERKGYTIVPVSMYWKRGLAKLDIAMAKGKQAHDKRETTKQRDWNREKQRILKNS
ncbi:MAG: SsrA-binding protein SmpB [Gammaproteobacteria bacterium]|nr:MAG: SsrA-binding protein SmpB [Gammaproteobacteria bacterium]